MVQPETKESRRLRLELPGNPRYQPKDLVEHFGYDYLYQAIIEVELAAMEVLFEIGIIPAEDYAKLTPKMREAIMAISTTEVDAVERAITKHDIRALVRLIQEVIEPRLRRWVHVPLTSYDPIESGRVLQYKRAHAQVISPKSRQIMKVMAGVVRKYANTLQIGRTHGQHAIPITVGFWLANILQSIVFNTAEIDRHAQGLVGKITGPVGADNAVVGLGIAQKCGPITFEARVLEKLGLEEALISKQILPPDPMAYYLFSNVMLSSSFGQLGRDCRHLMRSEIAEIGEPFAEGQVGSSTMAQKRNPISFENLEGTWLKTKNEFGKVLDWLISEHQRDLVGSSVARDFPTILVNLCLQMDTLLRADKSGKTFLERLTVNEANCRRNFDMSANLILAEPLYIALQMAGFEGDAHELINRKAVPLSQKTGQPLVESIRQLSLIESGLQDALCTIPADVFNLFSHPENYTGNAASKANDVATVAEAYAEGMEIDEED